MIFDTSSPLQAQQMRTTVEKLIAGKAIAEVKKKCYQRTLKQNNYCHVCLAYFASQYGERLEYVKRNYFKLAANRDLFLKVKHDRLLGMDMEDLISTADLTTEEMTVAIERFRNWSSEVAGIYIPPATSIREIAEMEIEIERNKMYI